MNLLTPILTGNASLVARIALVILLISTIALLHQLDATYNYHKGYNKSLVDHPQNVYNGPTTVIQGRKMSCFPLHIGSIGVGVCHD